MAASSVIRATSCLGLIGVLVVTAAVAACGNAADSTFGEGGDQGTGDDPNGGDFGPGGDGDGGRGSVEKPTKLVFEPSKQELVVDGKNPQSTTFKLRATLKSGATVDVAPESLQFDRPDLAAATNGIPVKLTTTGAFGGTGKLHGIYGGVEAIADLTVKVTRKDIVGSIPPNVIAALDGATLADPSLTTLRYPYDKTVFPLGLVSPLMMWDAPAAGDVYRIHLEQANYTYDLYTTVAAPAKLRVDQVVWDRFTASNSGDPLKVTLSRYSSATTTAYKSTSSSWTIAPASLRGAIYYWTASQVNGVRQGHIARIRPGVGSQPEVMQTGQADLCMGCHAVSADGSTLAASVEAAPTAGPPASYPYTNGWSSQRAWASFDLPSGAVRKQTQMVGNNLALTPDGKYTVFGGRAQTNTQAGNNQWEAGSKYMTLADTKTGTVVANSGLDDMVLANAQRGVAMPAFSPDGKKFTVVEFNSATSSIRDNVLPDSTQILVLGFNQGTLKFTSTPTRLPLGTFTPYTASGLGYPSFTADGAHVAFHVGNHSTGCFGACDDTVEHRGALYYQTTDGVGTPVRLSALNDPPAASDREMSVEPTFNPVERGGYHWAVFTSMRDWGNELTGTANNGKRRLWVGAIDAAGNPADPSHPPFYLEGQEDSPNMRGFWTLAACTPTPKPGAGGGQCTAGFECCSGFCDKGVCVDASKLSCVGIGGSCATSGDCCNPSQVSCTDGKCRAKVIR